MTFRLISYAIKSNALAFFCAIATLCILIQIQDSGRDCYFILGYFLFLLFYNQIQRCSRSIGVAECSCSIFLDVTRWVRTCSPARHSNNLIIIFVNSIPNCFHDTCIQSTSRYFMLKSRIMSRIIARTFECLGCFLSNSVTILFILIQIQNSYRNINRIFFYCYYPNLFLWKSCQLSCGLIRRCFLNFFNR